MLNIFLQLHFMCNLIQNKVELNMAKTDLEKDKTPVTRYGTLYNALKTKANIKIISRGAVIAVWEYLTDEAIALGKLALNMTKHAKRKTVTEADVRIALAAMK